MGGSWHTGSQMSKLLKRKQIRWTSCARRHPARGARLWELLRWRPSVPPLAVGTPVEPSPGDRSLAHRLPATGARQPGALVDGKAALEMAGKTLPCRLQHDGRGRPVA